MIADSPPEEPPPTRTEDLGFGTRVRTGRGDRLLNRDGSFTVLRQGLPLRARLSLSHSLMTMSWPVFLSLVVVLYVTLNTVFALGFLALGPDAIEGPGSGFERAFFFSVQTATTIGYGQMLPATTGANLLAAVEALSALIAFALVTGLVYARFVRPVADIVFSEHAIMAPYHGRTGLQFRIANQRRNQIIELRARVFLSRVDRRNGHITRSFMELKLERDRVAFFPLSWTIVHPVDEESPLFGSDEADLLSADAELMIMLNGVDDTLSQPVHARSSYKADEIVWHTRFANIFRRTPSGNPVAIDLAHLSELEPAHEIPSTDQSRPLPALDLPRAEG